LLGLLLSEYPLVWLSGVGGLVVVLLVLLCPTTIPLESEFPLLLLLRLGDGLLPMLPLRLFPSAVAESVVQLLLLFFESASFVCGLLSAAALAAEWIGGVVDVESEVVVVAEVAMVTCMVVGVGCTKFVGVGAGVCPF
jgi:hypothetical protein